ncbi:MAG TPA: tail fiber protein [Symbiobacteriaceae bacterium]|nr:tail fiber protein [Symbiobacteriaceae bacterium]
MAEPFLGEIRLMSFNFPPKGWALCNGQFLPINQNQALFSLLGTTYGGNGQTTFALPNLRGRAPMHMGDGLTLGQAGGETAHTVTVNEMPQHGHSVQASGNEATASRPRNATWAASTALPYSGQINQAMNPATVTSVGGSQPHNNMQPYLTISFCIALQGIFPSQN